MLPIPTRSVFRNRWWTLAWAAGIVWTAVEIGGGQSDGNRSAGNEAMTDASGAAVSADQARQAAALIAKLGG